MTDLSAPRRWGKWFEEQWTKQEPAPLEISGSEVVAFLDEYEVAVTWTPASRDTLRICTLTSDAFPTTKGASLDEAVKKAAGWLKEENE